MRSRSNLNQFENQSNAKVCLFIQSPAYRHVRLPGLSNFWAEQPSQVAFCNTIFVDKIEAATDRSIKGDRLELCAAHRFLNRGLAFRIGRSIAPDFPAYPFPIPPELTDRARRASFRKSNVYSRDNP